VKAHPKTSVSCNRSALDLLPEAVRKAELIPPQGATFGKLQKSNLAPSVSVVPLRAPLGSRCRLVPPSIQNTASRCRHFLTKLRGRKQLKSRAAGSQPEVKWKILMVYSRDLTAGKKSASRARGLLGRLARVVARLLPDRPDFLMPHHCFQGSKYECRT
jgi:hypothetical protein